jgi:carbon-monoxide dehydrogenase medium subunit
VPDELFAGAETVVDLSRLDLATIRQSGHATEFGALVTLQDLIEMPWRKDAVAGILSEAAQLAAHPGLRQLATVGGVLLAKDGPPEILLALLVLEASVTLYGPGQARRDLALADYLARADRLAGEVVAYVWFERPSTSAAAGLARVARTPRDEAIVAAAAALVVVDGTCRQARLSLAGAGVMAQRVTAAEALLEGQTLTGERISQAAAAAPEGLAFISDLRGSAAYRQAMAVVVARRSLTAAWHGATKAS